MLIFWRSQWHPTPVLLPGKSHGQRSLVGCSPWGCKESDTPEQLHFHFSLSCIGEGNGNPLQCSCLENPRDGGAWCAAVYGVAQSRTRLKRLSSSSMLILGLPRWDASVVKNLHEMQEMRETLVPSRSLKTPWRRKWQPMSLRVGHDWVASLSLSCIGEGNGNPLQCSCLENPREEGA